jgi:hypothetical protein
MEIRKTYEKIYGKLPLLIFVFLTVVSGNITVLWGVTPYSLVPLCPEICSRFLRSYDITQFSAVCCTFATLILQN